MDQTLDVHKKRPITDLMSNETTKEHLSLSDRLFLGLAMKSTEKQTLSFQETTRPQSDSNH